MALNRLPKRLHPDYRLPRHKPTGPLKFDENTELTKGTIAYWLFNTDERDIQREFSNSQNAVVFGGNRAKLNGTSSRVVVADDDRLDGLTAMTVHVEIDFIEDGANDQTVFAKHANAATDRTYQLAITPSNIVEFGVSETVSAGLTKAVATNALTTGRRYRLTGVWDGTTVKVYIDGRLEGTASLSGTMRTNNNELTIGCRFRTAYDEFQKGAIYYAHFLNVGHTDAQVRRHTSRPYDILRPKTPLFYFVGDGVGSFTLAADSGTYTYTGTAASLEQGANLAADSGSYVYTGTTVDLNIGFSLAVDPGTYTYTGTAAALLFDALLDAASGSYTYTGTAASLEFGAHLAADSGTYTYTGTDVTLTFESPGDFTLSANSGTYSYSGTNADLVAAFVVGADSGSYTYTGTAAALDRGFTLGADTGTYTYSGTAVDLTLNPVLAADSGTYTYAGTNVILQASGQVWTIQADAVTTWAEQADSSTTWTIQ